MIPGIGIVGKPNGGPSFAEGQLQMAVGQYIYKSIDYGVTWVQKTTDQARNWLSIATNSTGQYQLASVSYGSLYRSIDYGETWTAIAIYSVRGCSISETGQYQTIVLQGARSYRSSDYGASWTQVGDSLTSYGVAVSKTGQYQVIAATAAFVYRSTNYGVTWSYIGNQAQYRAVAQSYDTGQYLLNVGATCQYASANSGTSFTDLSAYIGMGTWLNCGINNNGQYQIIAASWGYVYISTNYGSTFSVITTLGIKGWSGVSISSSGKYISLSTGTTFYYSNDYGITWNQSTISTSIIGICMPKI